MRLRGATKGQRVDAAGGTVFAVAYRVRPPTPADAAALGAVHVLAWQAAYRGGLVPDEHLDALSSEARAAS